MATKALPESERLSPKTAMPANADSALGDTTSSWRAGTWDGEAACALNGERATTTLATTAISEKRIDRVSLRAARSGGIEPATAALALPRGVSPGCVA